jgi:site-specific recombinase XerD
VFPGGQNQDAPRNKGMLYPADPPTVEEIVCVMRHASNGPRLQAMIVMLWRGGLRIQEALALSEHDLDPAARLGARAPRKGRASAQGRHGRLGLGEPQTLALIAPRTPIGPLFCVIDGPTRGRPWSAAAVRTEFRRHAAGAGVRRRFAPHQLRHAHALELAHEGVSLNVIQRQLGHANLGTTSIYLQGIDIEEIISTVHARRAPMMSATAGLQL